MVRVKACKENHSNVFKKLAGMFHGIISRLFALSVRGFSLFFLTEKHDRHSIWELTWPTNRSTLGAL